MKQLLIIFLVFLLKGHSCTEPPVVFDEPQPEKLPAKSYFEPIYRGTFLCESDSAMVHVHAKTVFKEKAFAFKLALDEIEEDSLIDYFHGQLFIKNQPDPISANLEGDTVRAEIILRDTLFEISENQILKYFRGHHVLNKKVSDNLWEVEVLSLVGDLDLRYAKAEMPEDIHALEKITPVRKQGSEGRKPHIVIDPTVIEFNEIIQQELIFRECDYFSRQQFPTSI